MINNFAFGDIVKNKYTGQIYTVNEIQGFNGIDGSIICYGEGSDIPYVAGPTDLTIIQYSIFNPHHRNNIIE